MQSWPGMFEEGCMGPSLTLLGNGKKRGSPIKHTKIPFFQIKKMKSKMSSITCFCTREIVWRKENYERLSQGSINRIFKSLLIDGSNHSEDSCLKVTQKRVVKSQWSINNSSFSRVMQNLQVMDHEEWFHVSQKIKKLNQLITHHEDTPSITSFKGGWHYPPPKSLPVYKMGYFFSSWNYPLGSNLSDG